MLPHLLHFQVFSRLFSDHRYHLRARAVVGPRMESLQTYLSDLMLRPEVARGEALSSFLELNSASQLIASAL
jgi:hypothetical protein